MVVVFSPYLEALLKVEERMRLKMRRVLGLSHNPVPLRGQGLARSRKKTEAEEGHPPLGRQRWIQEEEQGDCSVGL